MRVPSSLGFWVRGQSYPNFLAPTVGSARPETRGFCKPILRPHFAGAFDVEAYAGDPVNIAPLGGLLTTELYSQTLYM